MMNYFYLLNIYNLNIAKIVLPKLKLTRFLISFNSDNYF